MTYQLTSKDDTITVTVDDPSELLEFSSLVAFYRVCWPGEHEGDPEPEAIAEGRATQACWHRAAQRLETAEKISFRLTHRITRKERTLHVTKRQRASR